MPRPLKPQERQPARIVAEDGQFPESVQTDVENLTPTEIRSPDQPKLKISKHKKKITADTANNFMK